MIRELLTDNPTINLLKRGLEATSLRHRVISDNIVSIGTPGHQPREVHFESLFTDEIAGKVKGTTTDAQHRSMAVQKQMPRPEVVDKVSDLDAAQSLEAEMVALIENSAKHRTLVKLLSGNYKAIVTAIRGRSLE